MPHTHIVTVTVLTSFVIVSYIYKVYTVGHIIEVLVLFIMIILCICAHVCMHACMVGVLWCWAPAVNFWYDMEFDLKYCYHKLLENMTQPNLRKLNSLS